MQRKATKQSPGPNAEVKRFHYWLKDRGICCVCGNEGGVILDHCKGSTFKHNKVQIGHWFVLGLCYACDCIHTHGSTRKFIDECGPQSGFWIKQVEDYTLDTGDSPPADVYAAIVDWGQ